MCEKDAPSCLRGDAAQPGAGRRRGVECGVVNLGIGRPEEGAVVVVRHPPQFVDERHRRAGARASIDSTHTLCVQALTNSPAVLSITSGAPIKKKQ